jgi:hypothetical protein
MPTSLVGRVVAAVTRFIVEEQRPKERREAEGVLELAKAVMLIVRMRCMMESTDASVTVPTLASRPRQPNAGV